MEAGDDVALWRDQSRRRRVGRSELSFRFSPPDGNSHGAPCHRAVGLFSSFWCAFLQQPQPRALKTIQEMGRRGMSEIPAAPPVRFIPFFLPLLVCIDRTQKRIRPKGLITY